MHWLCQITALLQRPTRVQQLRLTYRSRACAGHKQGSWQPGRRAGTALQSWVSLWGCSQHSNKSPRGHKDNPRASQDEIPRGERKVFIHIRHSVPLANKEDETKPAGKVKSCSKHRAAAQQSLPAPGSAAGCEHCRTAQLCASTSQHPVLGIRFT